MHWLADFLFFQQMLEGLGKELGCSRARPKIKHHHRMCSTFEGNSAKMPCTRGWFVVRALRKTHHKYLHKRSRYGATHVY